MLLLILKQGNFTRCNFYYKIVSVLYWTSVHLTHDAISIFIKCMFNVNLYRVYSCPIQYIDTQSMKQTFDIFISVKALSCFS